MNKNKLYLGVIATRQNTETVIQYTAGPFYYPKTDEDWNNLQDSMVKKFNKEFNTGWSFHVYEIPKKIYDEYNKETKELFDDAVL